MVIICRVTVEFNCVFDVPLLRGSVGFPSALKSPAFTLFILSYFFDVFTGHLVGGLSTGKRYVSNNLIPVRSPTKTTPSFRVRVRRSHTP